MVSGSLSQKICIVSGHYPQGTMFADLTREILMEYARIHDYTLYYDSKTPVPRIISELHFRRCLLLRKASEVYPECDWFVWLDTDIYIQGMEKRIEEHIDLSDPTILYHLFHEQPWKFPVNTGVKFVHRNAIHWEDEIYSRRNECEFPYEQKIVIDYILPTYTNKVKIHDPQKLNCIYRLHHHREALFVHVCNLNEINRNFIILKNTRKLLESYPNILRNKYYRNFHLYHGLNFFKKAIEAIQVRITNIPLSRPLRSGPPAVSVAPPKANS
jgi:hypothetical protein